MNKLAVVALSIGTIAASLLQPSARQYRPPLAIVARGTAMPAAASQEVKEPQSAFTSPSTGSALTASRRVAIAAAFARQPLRFVKNQGQLDPRVAFTSREKIQFYEKASGHATYFTQDGVYLNLVKFKAAAPKAGERPATPEITGNSTIKLSLIGSEKNPEIVAEELQAGKVNSFIGSDSQRWRHNIPTYGAVRYKNVYQGVDVRYYGNNSQLEYDVTVKPGAALESVRFSYDGIKGLEVMEDGSLEIALDDGKILQKKPYVYQQLDGRRVEVSGGFKVIESGKGRYSYAFDVASYDKAHDLVIDPTLTYSTYLGGGANDVGRGIAADEAGNVYITGETYSPDFPVSNPLQPSVGGLGSFDVFITKIDASGVFVYSTFLGSNGGEVGYAIAADGAGNAYITGHTNSVGFPVLHPLQPAGSTGAFVAKVDAFGALAYAIILGTNSDDTGRGIAVDGAGNAYVTGKTRANNFPTTPNALQRVFGGPDPCGSLNLDPSGACGFDAFVTKIDAAGHFAYSTYLGGSSHDAGNGIAVDGAGNTYVVGETCSTDFPTSAPPPSTAHLCDAFVTKLDASGGLRFGYSIYLGGGFYDYGYGIAVDGSGNAYVTGKTMSIDFPTLSPLQGYCWGCGTGMTHAFVTKLDAAGAFAYSTYLGGSSYDGGYGIAVDGAGNAYVTGYTQSADFPVKDPLQPANGGAYDAFVTRLDAAGALAYSTYLGGSLSDLGNGIAVDGAGNAYVTGSTQSADLPTLNPLQPANAGGLDAFVTRIDFGAAPTLPFSVAYTIEAGFSSGLSPSIGTASTVFTYKVVYRAANNLPPVAINVCIDAVCSAMTLDTAAAAALQDGNYANSEQYAFTTTLSAGAHTYHFEASDGTTAVTLPATGDTGGPTVSDPPVVTGTMPEGAQGVPYSAGLSASGGTPPYTWSASGLRAGFTIDPATGVISNSSPVEGLYSVTVTVTDANGNASSMIISISINAYTTPPPTQAFNIVDLGTIGGGQSVATAMNSLGHVVGYSSTANNSIHAFLYSNGVMADLGAVGGTRSQAVAINDSGQVVGTLDTASGTHAFLYSNGQMTDLGTLGGIWSSPRAINNSGQVVGWSYAASGDQHAFLYSNGVMTDLGTFGGRSSEAWAINDSGQVVGWSETASGAYHAFLYSNGVMSDLGSGAARAINSSGQMAGSSVLASGVTTTFLYANGVRTDLGTLGGARSLPVAMNSSGQVIGALTTANNAYHAFLYSNGAVTDLGTLGGAFSSPFAINGSGQVVGMSTILNFRVNGYRAFLYSNGAMRYMSSLSPAWHSLSSAVAINDSGQIAGYGRINGQTHAFVTVSSQGADVAVTVAASPATVNVGQPVTITATVTNSGPDAATTVALSMPMTVVTRDFTGISVTPSQGTCDPIVAGNPILCTLGTLAPAGAPATITIVATPTSAVLPAGVNSTSVGLEADVSATETDPITTNNHFYDAFNVGRPRADVAVTVTASPATVNVGQPVTITATVTNSGPDAASLVTVSGFQELTRVTSVALEPHFVSVSASASQGSCAIPGVAGDPIACALGPLAPSASATVTIVATPVPVLFTGINLTTRSVGIPASVTAAEVDPVPANNSPYNAFDVTRPPGQLTNVGPGANIAANTAQGTVTVTYSGVTQAGFTNVVATSSAPALPANCQLAGSFFDITTTAAYGAPVKVCITPVVPLAAATVLMHFESGAWVALPAQQLLPVGGPPFTTVCAETSSFSAFAAAVRINHPPTADAGPDQIVGATTAAGASVILNGAGSDPDGDALTFAWSGACGSASTATATFTCPVGASVMTLTVNDGHTTSAPDTVIVTVQTPAGTLSPIADAGPDKIVLLAASAPVQLDGSGSRDLFNDPITYTWTITSAPDASTGMVLTGVRPFLTPGTPGRYVISLVVNDGLLDSAADTVVISVADTPKQLTLGRVNINTSAGDQFDPHVDGDLAAYSEITSTQQIRHYRFSTGVDQAISNVQADGTVASDLLSDVQGGRIVFTRVASDRNAVMLFDPAASPSLVEVSPKAGSNRIGVGIGGRTLAYVDLGLGSGGEIVVVDLAKGNAETRLTNDTVVDQNVAVSPDGKVVVWERCQGTSPNGCDIFQAVLASGAWTVSAVTTTTTANEESPDTDGSLVVYHSNRGARSDGYDVFCRAVSGGAETQLQLPGDQIHASISGGVIAFESRVTAGGNSDIYLYEVATNRLFQVTATDTLNESLNDVAVLANGEVRVVWDSDDEVIAHNVYGATFQLADLFLSPPSVPAGVYADGVDPDTGTASTPFTFKTVYTSVSNRAPYRSYMKVCIDDACHDMAVDALAPAALQDGNYANGEQFTFSTTLAAGTHSYYFTATDNVLWARWPVGSGEFNGPVVSDLTITTVTCSPYSYGCTTHLAAVGGTGPYTWSASGLPAGVTIDPATGIMSGAAPPPGTYTFTVSVTDSNGYVYDKSFTVTIAGNHPPTADAGPDQTVDPLSAAGASVTLNGAGSDPDGGSLTFAWSGPCGTASTATAAFICPVGTSVMTLTVDDGHATSAPDTVTVTVRPPPTADLVLVITASPATVHVGQPVTLTAVVTNTGPDPASQIRLTGFAELTGENGFWPTHESLAVTTSQGACWLPLVSGAPIRCALGSLGAGASATVTIVATPTEAVFVGGNGNQLTTGVTVFAVVGAAERQTNRNNQAWSSFGVDRAPATAAVADLTLVITASPAPPVMLHVGQPVTLTAVVTNTGPAPASQVRLTGFAELTGENGLWPTHESLSVSASQGACWLPLVPGAPIRCALGSLGAGASATVTIVATPTDAVFGGLGPAHNVIGVTVYAAAHAAERNTNRNFQAWLTFAVDRAPATVVGQGAPTPAGTNVIVQPTDPAGVSQPITLTFSEVTKAGTTAAIPLASAPMLPGNFKLRGLMYDITTTAEFRPPVTVCLDGSFDVSDEIVHFENGAWVALSNQKSSPASGPPFTRICADTDTLSPFAVAAPNRAPTADAGGDQTVEAASPAGAMVTLNGSGSDPDGDALTFAWSGSCGSASAAGATFVCPLGPSAMTLMVTDSWGFSTEATVSITVRDTTPPDIVLTTPADGATYILNQQTNASFSCTDGGAGIASCSGTAANGARFDTTSVGAKTFTVTATDAAGNRTSTTVAYSVIFAGSGRCLWNDGHQVLWPIEADGSSVFLRGLSVPARFRVCDANGGSIGSPSVVSSFKLVRAVSNGVIQTLNQDVPSALLSPLFRWDQLLQEWEFVIKTKGYVKGTTYSFRVTLSDATFIDFRFALK